MMIAWEAPRLRDRAHFVAALVTFLDDAGRTRYDGAVSHIEHALQAATLARSEGAPDTLVVAALLHDVGHLLLDQHDADGDFLQIDRHHEAVGARFLSRWFPEEVVIPIALHVDAKRYIVGIHRGYAAALSETSRRTLALQGGPMTAVEAEAFRAHPYADAALALRRWDDRAKVAGLTVPSVTAFVKVISATVAATVSSSVAATPATRTPRDP